MNPLLKRLASLRRKVRVLDAWLGICAIVALVLGVGVSVGALDFWVHLPSLVRAVVLIGLLIGSGLVVYRYLWRPFSKSCDDLNLALRIEEAYPELNDALASTVQFLKQSTEEQARIGGSSALRERTVAATVEKASLCDFSRILDRRAGVLFGAAALCVLFAAGAVLATSWDYAGIAFLRLVEPFGQHTWTTLEVQRLAPVALHQQGESSLWEPIDPDPAKPDRVAKDQPYKVKVRITGQIPKQAKVEIVGQIRHDSIILLEGKNFFEVPINMTQQFHKFKFRITANDGAFPPRPGTWHEVDVRPPPGLIDLDGQPSPQITVYPPAYTDLPSPQPLLAGTRNIDVIAGTQVVLRAKANRPLQEAWIEFRPDNDLFLPLSRLSLFGETNPLAAVGQAAAGGWAWSSIPAEFEGQDRTVFTIRFTPWLSGGYVLFLVDKDRLAHSEAAQINVQRDPVPEVRLLSPASSITRVPDAKVSFKFLVADEQFAIKSVWVEHRIKPAPNADVQDVPELFKNPVYDADAYGKLIPYLFAKMGKAPLMGPEMRLRQKKLDVDMVWSLKDQFKVGDVVEVQICADDFCDVYAPREPGRSHTIELRIISAYAMKRQADQAVAEILKQTQRAEKVQKKAHDGVKDANKLDKTDAKTVDQFIEGAEQPQREVQDIIGRTSDEGLRRELKELRQMLKDNNLENTQAFRDAGEIKGALDSVAQSELPQIDPKIAEIRNDLAKKEEIDPKTHKKLDETAKLQERVLKSLGELNRKLDPSAKMREFRNQISDITEKERILQQDLEKINSDKEQLDKGANPDQKAVTAKEVREKLNQKAKEQAELANQVQQLLKEMKAEKDQQEKLGAKENKDNAEKLKQAIEKLENRQPEKKVEEPKKLPVDVQMKDVANQLKDKTQAPPQELTKQNEIIKTLDKALEALEGKNEDTTKKAMKDRQDAQKELDKLAKKAKELEQKAKDIEKLEDPQEKLKAKQELAKEMRDFQEQLDKTRRELARLQEQRAANDLEDAIQKMEAAANKARDGGDPQQDQKQARDKINEAKKEIKEAEEELAREQLIKIADQLKALKERQDATLERSEKLHSKILKLKSWQNSFLDTIEGNIDNQKGIGEETESLAEKLKEAKVFHGTLKRAKKGMDDAAEEMTNRRELGKELRYVEMEGDQKMDAKELKEEKESHDTVMRHQKQAAKSLNNMLEAIKEEIAKQQKKKENPQAKNPDDPPKEEKGGMRAQDGIPSKAQLKLLQAEQRDLMEQTKGFDDRNPDRNKLTEAQRMELRQLLADQETLQEWFGGLVAPPPMPKEGELP